MEWEELRKEGGEGRVREERGSGKEIRGKRSVGKRKVRKESKKRREREEEGGPAVVQSLI